MFFELGISFIISAFIAGMLTFLAPCTLPLIPAYIAFISGVQNTKTRTITSLEKRSIFLNGLFFIVGFSIVFISFGALAGLIGQNLTGARPILSNIGGVIIIFFGLGMLGVLPFSFLSTNQHIRITKFIRPGNHSSSLLVGSAFAFGWTPCVGPILGSILLLASTSNTTLTGTMLLAVFSMGLAVPFLLLTLFFAQVSHIIDSSLIYQRWVSIIGGIFLVGLGILLLTNNFGIIIEYSYKTFEFLDYNKLLEYL